MLKYAGRIDVLKHMQDVLHICLNMQLKLIHVFEPASYIDVHACVVLSMQVSMFEYPGPINVHVWYWRLSLFILTLLFKHVACADAQV